MKERTLEQQLEDIRDEIDAARSRIIKVGGAVSMENYEREAPLKITDLGELDADYRAYLKSARTSLRAAAKYLVELIGEDT